jgi:hypothetical protein
MGRLHLAPDMVKGAHGAPLYGGPFFVAYRRMLLTRVAGRQVAAGRGRSELLPPCD